jgi:hypothetical protein
MTAIGSTVRTSDTADERLFQGGTLPLPAKEVQVGENVPETPPESLSWTQSRVEPSLRGDARKQDETPEMDPGEEVQYQMPELVAKRQECSRRLSGLVANARRDRGTIAMAADVQLLKRELSRAHTLLGASRSESNYVSIITLVEATLASLDWKTATEQQLLQVQKALEVGGDSSTVTFDDFNKQRRLFRGNDLPTFPKFDFSADEDGFTEDNDSSEPE